MARLFTACIGITPGIGRKPQLALGRQISPILAGIGYSASISGILSIKKWGKEETMQKKLSRISFLHQPGQSIGLNMVQELLAKTRATRTAEESRTWYLACEKEGHYKCGVSHVIHLSS